MEENKQENKQQSQGRVLTKDEIMKYAKASSIPLDSIITSKDVNKKTIEDLEMLEPFGEKNKVPIFVYKNLKIDSIRALSEGKHLKLTLKDDNLLINAIGFNLGYLSEEYLIGDKIDIVGNLEINKYGGEEIIQINLKDVMKSI